MQRRIIGIDLAVTAKHKAVILDQQSNEFVGGVYSFGPTPAELEQLLEQARVEVEQAVEVVAVLEATGMAWYPVSVYLSNRGVQVYRLNGQMTKDLRRVYWKHAGSDQIDSRVLARLYLIAPERLHQLQVPRGDELALQRACRELGRWREQIIAIKNRVQAYDQVAWNGLHKVVPAVALEWMRRNWYDPWLVQQTPLEELKLAWQQAAASDQPHTHWLAGWQQRAEQMTALYGSAEWLNYPALQQTIQRELDRLDHAHQASHHLKLNLIRPLYRQLHPSRVLESVVGVGQDSAATYLAFIHDISRFPTVAKFRKWTGLVPGSHQSGHSQASGLSITQAGPDLLKATLYLNANTARLWDPQLAHIYYTQMVHYGKHHNQAICACASHLANRIYAVLKHDRPYDLRDPQGNSISKAEARTLCQEHYQVPDHIRKRNNVWARRKRAELRTERKWLRQQQA